MRVRIVFDGWIYVCVDADAKNRPIGNLPQWDDLLSDGALFVRMRRQCSRGHIAVRQRLSVSIVRHFVGFLEPYGLQIDGRRLRLSEVE